MSIDLQNLPPMSSFIALEAVVRHLSFTQAARELRVTPAAVSQQVKALEDRLGIELIRRVRPQIHSTVEADGVAEAVRKGIDTIEQAVLPILQKAGDNSVKVATVTAFASFWLMPRLPRFFAAHPGVEVELLTREREIRQGEHHFDIGICYVQDRLLDVELQVLFRDELIPVCSPRFLENCPRPFAVEDMLNANLLHLVPDDPWAGWPEWFQAHGFGGDPPLLGPKFSNTILLVQAALDGHGIALGWRRLIEPMLKEKRLVKVTNHMLVPDWSYALAMPKTRTATVAVNTFKAWLIEEAQSDW